MLELAGTSAVGRQEPDSLPFSLEQESFFGPSPVSASNIAVSYRMAGHLDVGALQAASGLLAERHEALRFRLTPASCPRGQVIPPAQPLIGVSGRITEERLWEHLDGIHSAPLDLVGAGPAQFRLGRITSDEHVLCMTVHPAALDAWGIGVVQRDLWELYDLVCQGLPAESPARPPSFSDHVRWQRSAGGALTPEQREYHARQFSGFVALPAPDVPTPGLGRRDDGPAALLARRQFTMDASALRQAAQVARNLRVTTSSLFLAGFELALCLALDSESGGLSYIYLGRDRPGSEAMAAALARRIPMRFAVAPADTLADVARRAMRDWAAAVGCSAPPYSSARLVGAMGGPGAGFEPVFNYRVADATGALRRAGAGQTGAAVERSRPRVWRVSEPRPRPMPMWPQFGASALFASVTAAGAPNRNGIVVDAVYDSDEIPAALVKAVFGAFKAAMLALVADGGNAVTFRRLHDMAQRNFT